MLALPAITDSTARAYPWYRMTGSCNDTMAILRGIQRCMVASGPVKYCRTPDCSCGKPKLYPLFRHYSVHIRVNH